MNVNYVKQPGIQTNYHKSEDNSTIMPEHLKRINKDIIHRPVFAKETDDPLAYGFDRKVAVHPGMEENFVTGNTANDLWNTLLQKKRTGKTVAYFHIPVCETRCLFCGFYSNPLTPDFSKTYVDALITEMEQDRKHPFVWSGPVHAVYLGGGTPTALDAKDLERLLMNIHKNLPLANDCEITVEGRIHNFDKEKTEACINGGANRFSIGVQTFNTDIRRRMGRLSDRKTVTASLETLMKNGHASVIIDLIYGLPGQSIEVWEEDINTLLAMEVDGADLYQLNVFKDSPLEKSAHNGNIEIPPGLSAQSAYFARGIDIMTRSHYRRLSVCHWGRETRERNLYNLFFKQRCNSLAYGAGAGGNICGHFFMLQKKLKHYMESLKHGKPLMAIAYPPADELLVSRITGGFETGNINLRRLGSELDTDLEKLYKPVLDQWERIGMIERDNGWITLTLAGQFWQVNLTQALIDYFRQQSPAEQKNA